MDLTTFEELKNNTISNNDLKGMLVSSIADNLDWIIITSFGDERIRGIQLNAQELTSQPEIWQTTQAYLNLSDFVIHEILGHALDEGYTPTQAELSEICLYSRMIARPRIDYDLGESCPQEFGNARLESEIRGGLFVHTLVGEQ